MKKIYNHNYRYSLVVIKGGEWRVGKMNERGTLVFMKHLALGSKGPADIWREETHLVDAVMGGGVGVRMEWEGSNQCSK